MRALEHPSVDSVDLPALLQALADPVRLDIVAKLMQCEAITCGGFDVPVSMSTLSHHLKVLRMAGLLRVIQEGSFRRNELRYDEIEARFPGVLSSILRNVPDQLGATAS
ncbi:putative transcriptional regulator, ArsR family [Nocardia nova SH22a]|uniref:Putative transcriptional regulator, ArsR family n=1 Tax=Nocardia nova SH22a TaxID=1415166 RepID=W5TT40_9NOCA|nr:helix-turn-helix domain-containing protein [Nocardia nova]AHH20351.1 putative transcriptional regulator, ArsR family [Nocardia nova SH22a]